MHRFYLPPEQCSNDSLTLRDREAHHALHVLRLREGDAVEILDGAGARYRCRVTNKERHALQLSVEEKRMEERTPWQITLLSAITKPKAFEMIVQKAAELGVARLIPILTERVVVKTSGDRFNLEKWNWVAIDAIKQCGSPWLPVLEPPRQLPELLENAEPFDLSWVASLRSTQHPRHSMQAYMENQGAAPRNVAMWIGPEGDFTDEELQAIETAGAQPISLGPLVLRADTAAIYGVSMLNYELSYWQMRARKTGAARPG